MANEKASRTAYKVALNIMALGSKPGMDGILPPGILEATENLLLYSGAVGPKTLKWSKSNRAVSVYEAFDWMLPGQFEAFAYRKAFCERQVREGIDGGAVRILVLGAGYDTLGWRLAPELGDVIDKVYKRIYRNKFSKTSTGSNRRENGSKKRIKKCREEQGLMHWGRCIM